MSVMNDAKSMMICEMRLAGKVYVQCSTYDFYDLSECFEMEISYVRTLYLPTYFVYLPRVDRGIYLKLIFKFMIQI